MNRKCSKVKWFPIRNMKYAYIHIQGFKQEVVTPKTALPRDYHTL